VWQTECDNTANQFDEGKARWQRYVVEIGAPQFIINDDSGWAEVSRVPNNQVWSLITEDSYPGYAFKGSAELLRFGIERSARYFLVFDRAWQGPTANVVMSFTHRCTSCRPQPLAGRRNETRQVPAQRTCQRCQGQHRWTYRSAPAVRQRLSNNLPENWKNLTTKFSKYVLVDALTSEDALIHAATHGTMGDRVLVACNTACPAEFLNSVLAKDPDGDVRRAVAIRAHTNVTSETLAALCGDPDESVRASMALQRTAIVGTSSLQKFAQDVSATVRSNVVRNTDTPDDTVRALLESSGGVESKIVREALSRHLAIDPNKNLRFLTREFQDLFPNMIFGLLDRPDLTSHTIDEIRQHTETSVLQKRLDAYQPGRQSGGVRCGTGMLRATDDFGDVDYSESGEDGLPRFFYPDDPNGN
jgi:hypothetical protein